MLHSKRWMPTGALLALCIQQCSSFQPASPLAIRPNNHHPASRRPTSKLFAEDAANKKDEDCDCSDEDGPDILQPYLPAMDPNYSAKGPIGEGQFLISRSGPPTAEELSNEQMLKVVKSECTDLEVNTLVWKCLGYRFHEEDEEENNNNWTPDEVFPNWKERFPTPPDFIGMKRVYSKEVDQPSLRSNQALVRSIPADSKQSLKSALKPLGWTGFQVCTYNFAAFWWGVVAFLVFYHYVSTISDTN